MMWILNKKGAESFDKSLIAFVPRLNNNGIAIWKSGILIVDTRPQDEFRKGHLQWSIEYIQDGGKFGNLAKFDRRPG